MKVNILVKQILRELPKARNDDRYLQMVVWHKLGLVLTDYQREQFMNMPSAETITRMRRKLQERGQYEASEPIKRVRRRRSYIMRQNAVEATPDRLELILNQPYQERML